MLPGLAVGDQADLVWRVGAEHAIHLGYPPPSLTPTTAWAPRNTPVSAPVFSTPSMILLMERAARKAIEPYLEPGEASVGATVQIAHLAPTPLGAEVCAVARVTAIEGRTIDFEVTAHDRHEFIGRGTHRRAVVKLEKVARRIADKAKLGLGPVGREPGEFGSVIQPLAHELSVKESAAAAGPADGPLPLPQTTTLNVAVEGAIATVRLDRPQKKNAVNLRMTEDWEAVNCYLASRPEIRVVIVVGAGDDFCAGDDIPEVGTLSLIDAQEVSFRQARMYLAWEQLPQIFIAAVAGSALGGGCVAACACDFRIATHDATFGMPEVLLGWPPGYGVAQLTALVGKSRAMELCVTGQPITARQAADWGLVNRLVPNRELMTAARQLAESLLRLPATALAETKRLVHADEGLQPKVAYFADTAAYVRCLELPDARQGIADFQAKRLGGRRGR